MGMSRAPGASPLGGGSSPDSTTDLTAKARIRNAALTLFAAHGEEGTSVRAIAAEASVTAGLITHHFGSKARLREAVDEHVARLFAETIASVPAEGTVQEVTRARDAAVAAMLERNRDVLDYLRRDLLDPSAPSSVLIDRLAALALEQVRSLRAAGLASTRQAESTQAMSMIVRMLGQMFLQPLVDRLLIAMDSETETAQPEVVVSVHA